MSEKEGILRMMASGRWAVCRPGQEPVEISSGQLFRVEVAGELQPTRMEFDEGYYSIDDYPLRDGLRAAIGGHERIEEAEEDDEEWALQKARAKLAQRRDRSDVTQDPERKLLELAREVAVAAERLATCKSELSRISTDTARNARKDIAEATGHLQDLEKLLRDKIG
jgi:hypothetical protein